VELCDDTSKPILLDLMMILQLTRYRIDGGILERYDNLMESFENDLTASEKALRQAKKGKHLIKL